MTARQPAAAARIRVGVGGWTYEPWRNNFFPPGLAASARSWPMPAASSPASRSTAPTTAPSSRRPSPSGATKRRTTSCSRSRPPASPPTASCWPRPASRSSASSAAASPSWATSSGPIVWQFMPTKRFDAAGLRGFPALLPQQRGRRGAAPCARRAARELPSPHYLALARRYGCTHGAHRLATSSRPSPTRKATWPTSG